MRYQLIENNAELVDWLSAAGPDHLLAVDTEFFRETTYYPKLGLVQLAVDGQVACVDPLAFDANEALASVLLAPNIRKLFHSCSQDLEVLMYQLGGLPCPLFDTQVAAAFVSDRDQISYAGIVARNCGVELAKSQTRTNWLKRPLSDAQLSYAAEDVIYLEDVYDVLMNELDANGRRDWFEQDCARICSTAGNFEPDMDRCWLRVKGTQKMRPEQLAIVDAMARWRENKAISVDLTRRLVMNDDAIIAAAMNRPTDTRSLQASGKWHKRLQQQDFEQILSEIEQTLAGPAESWPQQTRQRQTPEQREQVKQLMAITEECAKDLGLSQSLLGSRKEIESLINGQRELNMLTGWRNEIIGQRLLASL